MRYQSDLTDAQWDLIGDFFVVKKGKHLQEHDKRELVNAVLYSVKTGCQWRMLPKDFPPHDTVWSFYRRACAKGIWGKIMDKLAAKVRVEAGRSLEPSYCLIDSQSTKTANKNENRGIDGGKKRKAENGISLRI
jgi:putative transposase